MNFEALKKARELREQAIELRRRQTACILADPCDDSVVSRHLQKREQELFAHADFTSCIADGFDRLSGIFEEEDDE